MDVSLQNENELHLSNVKGDKKTKLRGKYIMLWLLNSYYALLETGIPNQQILVRHRLRNGVNARV